MISPFPSSVPRGQLVSIVVTTKSIEGSVVINSISTAKVSVTQPLDIC